MTRPSAMAHHEPLPGLELAKSFFLEEKAKSCILETQRLANSNVA